QFDLLPLQIADLRGPQTVAVGDQDHGRVAMPIAAMLSGAVHEPLDLALGEIAPLDCQVYDAWGAFLGCRFYADKRCLRVSYGIAYNLVRQFAEREHQAPPRRARVLRAPRAHAGEGEGGGSETEKITRPLPRMPRIFWFSEGGGLFWATSFGKNFRRRDRDRLLLPRWMDAAVYRAEVWYPFCRKHGRHRAVKRRHFITLLGGAVVAWPLAARAQQHVHVIGVLASHLVPRVQRFERKLREYGYVEGQNVRFVPRFVEGRDDLYPAMAAELVALPVDLIVTWGTPAALAAKQATSSIPVVMGAIGDPVSVGIVSNLARPSGNITR